MIAFEFPKRARNHADLEIDWYIEYYIHPTTGERLEATRDHQTVWMKGCKTCQNTLSACACGSRVEGRILLYERGENFGDQPLKDAFFRFFPDNSVGKGSLTFKDVRPLGPRNLDDALDDEGESTRAHNDFKVLDPRFVEHIKTTKAFGYVTYPISKLAEIHRLFKDHGEVLPFRPIISKPETETERGGASGWLSIQTPRDQELLSYIRTKLNAKELLGGDNMKIVDTYLLLQAHFDHGVKIVGTEWESEQQRTEIYKEAKLEHLLRDDQEADDVE
jgi:hypothetical protein